MSELEPRHPSKKRVAPRHVPELVVPVPIEGVRQLVEDATRGTTLSTILGRFYTGWMLLDMKLRVAPVDAVHTRIEIEVTAGDGLPEALLYQQRRSMIDRFFVAIRDELNRRARWQYPQAPAALEEGRDPAPPSQGEVSGNL